MRGELSIEDAHNHVVVPFVANVSRLPLAAFLGESASQVAANRSFVVSEDAKVNAVQAELLEAELEDEPGDSSAKTRSEQVAIKQPHRAAGAPIDLVEAVQACGARESSLELDRPVKRVGGRC